ncbi:hypothetical protein [Caldinitratiruptor microaerophilus]|uniref:SHOCT domain-containing protein n=1 Tax=Caldinitratiruptor microaerophilus TaxID=671077 RepID=A0AA35G8K8_9FIRM|nr:hypothetical protein [Caldinitratiruptor microaerophilus]BDG61130.1 hypothetical protein caldi_22200 [Caldinitratiruptor microaerophilus]
MTSYLPYAVGGFLFLALAAFALAPLRRRESGPAFDEEPPDPLQEREKVYARLADLEYDYRSGKMSEEEYQTLREALLEQAAALLDAEEGSR